MTVRASTSDHAHVRAFTRRSRSNFYYSFLFLPPAQREAIEAVYAFCPADMVTVTFRISSGVIAAVAVKSPADKRTPVDAPVESPAA